MSDPVTWFPESLQARNLDPADLAEHWSYVVLGEIVDNVVMLERWPWPYVDDAGRLDWPDEASVPTVLVPIGVLIEQLYTPGGLKRRPRVSDVLAVRGSSRARWRRRTPVADVSALFPDLVIDVTADARLAAKLAYQGALVTPLAAEDIPEELVNEAAHQRAMMPAPVLVGEPDGASPEEDR